MSIGSVLQMIGLNLVLSSDNAVCIALAAKGLEKELKKKAILWGSLLAAMMLIILTLAANYLLLIPFAGVMGGLFLLKVAFDLPRQMTESHEGPHRKSLKTAIKQIVHANLIMSFDNALALASAAHQSMGLIVIGVLVGSAVVMGGGHAVSWLLHKYPVLVHVGALILAHAAASMLLEDAYLNRYVGDFETNASWASLVIAVCVVLLSLFFKTIKEKRVLHEHRHS